MLTERHGWAPLRVLSTASVRQRLRQPPAGARTLKLGDVGSDLYIPGSGLDPVASLQSGRTLDRALLGGEVLLSTLGSSPRAAYVDEEVPPLVFPSDSWVRLRFRDSPAAWALLLSTPAIRRQIGRFAVGTVQQFVPPEALSSVHVPVPAPEVRERWQRTIERHHALRRDHDRRWAAVLDALTLAYDRVHAPLDAPTSPRRALETSSR